jgi:hypothetical protein
MPAGQVAQVGQQPGDLGDLPDGVGAGFDVQAGGDAGPPVAGEHRRPRVGGQPGDGAAGVGVDGPADGVFHPHAGILAGGRLVEALDPGQQLVGGAGAVGGDQQVAPPPGGDRGDSPCQ